MTSMTKWMIKYAAKCNQSQISLTDQKTSVMAPVTVLLQPCLLNYTLILLICMICTFLFKATLFQPDYIFLINTMNINEMFLSDHICTDA